MEKSFWQVLLVLFVFVLGGAILYRDIKDKELRDYQAETIGELDSFAECGVQHCYDYVYTIEGTQYKGRLKTSVLIPECRYGGRCKGRRFKVRYSTADRTNSKLDLSKEYEVQR